MTVRVYDFKIQNEIKVSKKDMVWYIFGQETNGQYKTNTDHKLVKIDPIFKGKSHILYV